MTKIRQRLATSGALMLILCAPALVGAESTPAPAAALASTDGEKPGTRIEIIELKRNSGDTVTLKYTLVNNSDHRLDLGLFLKADREGNRSSGAVALIDAAGKKKYLVVRDSDGKCLCSMNLEDVEPKTRINLWAKFPAPPADVRKITVDVPHFAPMDDVAISQ